MLEALFRTLFLAPICTLILHWHLAFGNFNFRSVSRRSDWEHDVARDAIFCLAFTARRLRSWKFPLFSSETQATSDWTFYTFSIRRSVFSPRDRYYAGRFPGFISPFGTIWPICMRACGTDGWFVFNSQGESLCVTNDRHFFLTWSLVFDKLSLLHMFSIVQMLPV